MESSTGGPERLSGLTSDGAVRVWKIEEGAPPLFIEAKADDLRTLDGFLAWVERNRDGLDGLMVRHGGLVLRGFPIAATEDFDRLVSVLGPSKIDYAAGAATRPKIQGAVYEATRLAANLKIPLHQEMAYLRDYPRRITFFCRRKAETGGETIIGDMRRVTRLIPEDLKERLDRLGARSIRNFVPPPPEGQPEKLGLHPDQRSWRYAFYADDPAEVDRICAQKGLGPTWHEDGSLTVETRLNVFTRHPVTGEKIYRSNAQHNDADYNERSKVSEEQARELEEMFSRQKIRSRYTLGDGSLLTKRERDIINAAFAESELSWPWKDGDVMILDNLLTAHGRNAFTGQRDVQVALLA